MTKDLLTVLAMWPVLFILRVGAIVAGVAYLPFVLPFMCIEKTLSQWKLKRLPIWAHPWDNPRDGIYGDRRLNYWNGEDQYPLWFDRLPASQHIKAYYWLAIRNPANNFSRYYRGLGCKIDECVIKLLGGNVFVSDILDVEGWQFTKAEGPLFNYYGFYLYKQVTSTRYLMIRLGHKVEPRYSNKELFQGARSSKAWKGFTFRISLRLAR